MLGPFWEQNKRILEIAAAVTAIGALFLAIPAPTEEKAREALAHIQFLWLFLISLLLLVVFTSLFLFTVLVEREVKGKYKFDFQSTISVIVLILAGTFVFRLWQYILAVYRQPMIETLRFLNIPVMGTVFVAWTYLRQRIVSRGGSIWSQLMWTVPLVILFALTLATWTALTRLQFSLLAWLRQTAQYLLGIVAIEFLIPLIVRLVNFIRTKTRRAQRKASGNQIQ